MKMAERFRGLIQRVDPQENPIIPSPFVLKEGDKERRLTVGEKFNLSFLGSTNIQDKKKMKSLEIDVSPNGCLTLGMTWTNDSSQNAKWGLRNEPGKKDNRKELQATLTKHCFTYRGSQPYIEGSVLYFEYSDGKPVKLHGENWTLEYKPL